VVCWLPARHNSRPALRTPACKNIVASALCWLLWDVHLLGRSTK
jgi:hypothetical protein